MKWQRLLRWVVAAAIIGGAWYYFNPSPERLVRKQLQGVARAATFAPGEGTISKLAGASRLAGFFSTNVEININLPEEHERRMVGRDDIQQAALAALASGQSLKVTFPDITIIVSADRQSAVADLTLLARYSGSSDQIAQEMKFTLRKIDGDWLIVKVETVRTLS
jgi:nitrogen fixation/metabolism regulation signal transduction histidine kinase